MLIYRISVIWYIQNILHEFSTEIVQTKKRVHAQYQYIRSDKKNKANSVNSVSRCDKHKEKLHF